MSVAIGYQVRQNVTTVNSATYDLLVEDNILHVTYTTTGAVTSLTWPTAQMTAGRVVYIKDAGGNAKTNTITIDTEGSETIDGQPTLVINNNYGVVGLYCDGSNLFVCKDKKQSALLSFGNNGVLNTVAARYLYPGCSDSLAPTSILNMVIPFAGTVKNMHVYHNVPAGNGNNIVYTLFHNALPSSLTVTIPSTTQTASNTINSVAVNAGDILALQVTKAALIGTSPADIIVTMEVI